MTSPENKELKKYTPVYVGKLLHSCDKKLVIAFVGSVYLVLSAQVKHGSISLEHFWEKAL